LWRCSSTGSSSSGLNFGSHISGCLHRSWRDVGIYTASGLAHGLTGGGGGFCFLPSIIGVWEEVDVEGNFFEEKAGCILVLDEMAPIL